ncbi:unnamed protein product [Cuscuta europaea]|uniref:Uncharacterized protein n=1 Tax=Cuscuta europaea TaxID=41803 RepID=A0A9P0ZBM2_CUSEU|nr:unnamed protein product [Cuscuta europaea]
MIFHFHFILAPLPSQYLTDCWTGNFNTKSFDNTDITLAEEISNEGSFASVTFKYSITTHVSVLDANFSLYLSTSSSFKSLPTSYEKEDIKGFSKQTRRSTIPAVVLLSMEQEFLSSM